MWRECQSGRTPESTLALGLSNKCKLSSLLAAHVSQIADTNMSPQRAVSSPTALAIRKQPLPSEDETVSKTRKLTLIGIETYHHAQSTPGFNVPVSSAL